MPPSDVGEPEGERINIPIPDPSLLTTKQLQREVFGLRELLEVKLSSAADAVILIRSIIETRLDGMDKAIRLLQDTADKFPARIDEKITGLRSVHDERFAAFNDATTEKFKSIETQFAERDVRTEQAAGAVKIAVDAALQAQKEAVGEQNKSSATAIAKSESATTKQIDQLSILIQSNTKAFDDKIGDVKDRLTRIEGTGQGGRAMWGYVAAGFGFVLTLLSIAAVAITLARR